MSGAFPDILTWLWPAVVLTAAGLVAAAFAQSARRVYAPTVAGNWLRFDKDFRRPVLTGHGLRLPARDPPVLPPLRANIGRFGPA